MRRFVKSWTDKMYKFKKVEDKSARIKQANIFFNYSICFESFDVDLLQVARKLLKDGLTKVVSFSDFKFIYLDSENKICIGAPEILEKDGKWEISLNGDVPEYVAKEVLSSLEIGFFESKAVKSQPHYLIASLPPIVLDADEYELRLFPSLKLFEDGIAVLSFQFDATWAGISEDAFINRFLNFVNYDFDGIWVDQHIQKIDADLSFLNPSEIELSVAGKPISNRAIKKLIKRIKKNAQNVVRTELSKQGRRFYFDGHNLTLHPLVGSKLGDQNSLSGSLAIEIYIRAIQSIVNPDKTKLAPIHWWGRPSVSLLRFDKQPEHKGNFVEKYSKFLTKILYKSAAITSDLEELKDLRFMDDYCLLANRSALLWCWTKSRKDAENAWDDENTRSRVYENQARAQFVEYQSAKITRACHWALDPASKTHLLYAYKNLGELNVSIRHSSHSGEIINTIVAIMEASGIPDIIESSKEIAGFHLDELKYNAQMKVSRQASLLSIIFGFVGTASLADFAFYPSISHLYPSFSDYKIAFISLLGAGSLVGITLLITWLLFKWSGKHQ